GSREEVGGSERDRLVHADELLVCGRVALPRAGDEFRFVEWSAHHRSLLHRAGHGGSSLHRAGDTKLSETGRLTLAIQKDEGSCPCHPPSRGIARLPDGRDAVVTAGVEADSDRLRRWSR